MAVHDQSNDNGAYGAIAKILHWTVFALLVVQYAVGWLMPHIGRDTPDEGWVAWHLSIGITILFAFALRLLWRTLHPVPPLAAVPVWQQRLALATHITLYAATVVIILLGWAAASYRGFPVTLFGLAPLPALAPKGTSWAHTAGDVHIVLVYVLLGVVGLHVGAALYHHFIRRDGVLVRMLPRRP